MSILKKDPYPLYFLNDLPNIIGQSFNVLTDAVYSFSGVEKKLSLSVAFFLMQKKIICNRRFLNVAEKRLL